MKQLFLDLLAQLQTVTFISGGVTATPFLAVWNNQVNFWRAGLLNDVSKPAILIEFVTRNVIVLGQGVEAFDPLDVKIHIVDDMLDAGDGTEGQNLRVFDYKQQVYSALKQFQPTNCEKLFRISETQDYNYDNLYHYIQTYRTSLIDASMKIPVGGQIYGPPSGFNTTVNSSFSS